MKEALKLSLSPASSTPRVDSSTTMVISDRELWNSFRSGSNAAFITIYNKLFDILYAYGIRINPSESLVEDAIHDVFYDLKMNCRNLGATDSIKFYLFKCLKRQILKEIKKWDSSRNQLEENDSFEIIFSHEQNLINRQLDFEKTQKINKAISMLSPRKREAIYYIFFEGLSYQQVSELMGLADAKSARDLTYKGLKVLREELGFLPLFIFANPLFLS